MRPSAEADFLSSGVIDTSISGYNDNYTNLWVGYLITTETGNFEFHYNQRDDWTGIWIDADQNGAFDSTPNDVGSLRGEQLTWNDGAVRQAALAALNLRKEKIRPRLQQNAMNRDFSWAAAVPAYLDIYREATNRRKPHL